MAHVSKADRAEAIERLRALLKPGDRVFVTAKHVSRSGMRREIAALVIENGSLRNISCDVARAVGYSWSEQRDAVKVDGCGMDLGFAVVYNLGRVLFPEGGSLEHSPRKRQEEAAGETRETDGGYLLRREWV